MARQILTFLLIFLGAILLFRMCSSPPGLPAAVPAQELGSTATEELRTLRSTDGATLIQLDAAGALVSVTRGSDVVVRPVPANRRSFTVMERRRAPDGGAGESTRALATSAWEAVDLPDGGVQYGYDAAGLRVVKRFSAAPDGSGLVVELEVAEAPDGTIGFEFTGPSGVAIDDDGAEAVAGVFWTLGSDASRFVSFDAQVQFQEEKRAQDGRDLKEGRIQAASPSWHRRQMIEPGVKLGRLGVLGLKDAVLLTETGAAGALNVAGYRVKRVAGETDELETWLSLPLQEGGIYRGRFELRWMDRDALDLPELRESGALAEAETLELEDDDFHAVLTTRGAALLELELKKFSLVAGEEPGPGNRVPILRAGVVKGSRALTLVARPEDLGADPAHQVWQASRDPDGRGVTFTLETPRGWKIVKRVTLPETGRYDLGVEIAFEAPADGSATQVRYKLIGPAGSYIADSYRGIIGAALPGGGFVERRGGEFEQRDISKLEKEALRHGYTDALRRGLLRAVFVRGAYFGCALVTEERTDAAGRPAGTVVEAEVRAIDLDRPVARPNGESSRASLLGSLLCEVPLEGRRAVERYRLYAGPNSLEELRPLQIEETVDFGFFGIIGRFLMWLMKALEGLVGSYGLAIMLMTLIVRACLLPVSYRTQLGMQRYTKKLQKIKPQLEELEKRYSKDKNKMNQERMRLMREHKIGLPLGCLMLFVQIPIWFALFGALRVEFSLRHQVFLWAQDLAMPDRLFALPFWPHWFNLLPFLMLALWVTQQKVAPQPGQDSTDPNMKMQMKMVKYMPYIFFFMLYNYAAALSVYMCVSSAWGIAEGRLVRRAIARQGL